MRQKKIGSVSSSDRCGTRCMPVEIPHPSYGLTADKQARKYGKTWLKTNKYQSGNIFCSHCLKTVISCLFKQGFQSMVVDNLQSDGM